MENTVFDGSQQTPENFSRFAIPVRWGIIVGLALCVMTTIQYMYTINSWGLFMSFWFITFIVSMVFYCIAGMQQRKAMGGYISFKDAFQAIFIVILISLVISSIYSAIYFQFIDPNVMEKIKEATISFMERSNVSQEQIDEAIANFDQREADSKNIGKMLLGFLYSVVIYSIFGFICAAIVKKKRPEFGA